MFHFLFIVLAATAGVFASSVTVRNPLKAQLPAVARSGQQYEWSFSSKSFSSRDTLEYTTSSLPSWLTFESASRTFRGTPHNVDEGTSDITVTAHASDSSASLPLSIYVSTEAPPYISIPVADQFVLDNPSLSSVLHLASHSALRSSGNPTLRIPYKWSFSIGFDGDTVKHAADGRIFYEVVLTDGTPIPDWMQYNPKTYTLNGVVPPALELPSPNSLSLLLIASDFEGYSALRMPFDLTFADHELSVVSSLPTINITSFTHVNFSLLSPADFTGVMVDGKPISRSNISSLLIDASECSDWLSYDRETWSLSGNVTPSAFESNNRPTLYATLTTTFNQSITSNISLALVQPYFSSDHLPRLATGADGVVQWSLRPFISNASHDDNAQLTVAIKPNEMSEFLTFNPKSLELSGTLPERAYSDDITVTFTAYSGSTHSTSHTNLQIQPAENRKTGFTRPSGKSAASQRHLALGLGISFGVIGGLCICGIILAAVRKWARVEDTAVDGEAGRRAWSDKDKQWYGLADAPSVPPEGLPARPLNERYGGLGLGLRRVVERSCSGGLLPQPGSPAVMRKKEFITRMKETVRHVSDSLTRTNKRRPVIGKPVLIIPSKDTNPSFQGGPSTLAPQTSPATSPSSMNTTKTSNTVRFEETLSRHPSSDSISSTDQAHAREAVVQTASRAMSIHSGTEHSATLESIPPIPATRPRLVPFTSSTRVPVPTSASNSPTGSLESDMRAESQEAMVDHQLARRSDEFDLGMGLHYVEALGADPVRTAPSTLTVSTNRRSSFSSMESSHLGHDTTVVQLAETGKHFKLRVDCSPSHPKKLTARLISGKPLPSFVFVAYNSPSTDYVEFYGVPSAQHAGMLNIGIYDEIGACISRVNLRIVGHAT